MPRMTAISRNAAIHRQAIRDFGTSLIFSGSVAQKLVLTQTSGLPLYNNTAFSVSYWVKHRITTTSQVHWAERNPGNGNPFYIIQTDTAGRIALVIRNNSNATICNVLSSTALLPGRWYHVTWVDNNGTVKLYINSTEDASSVAGTLSYTRGSLTLANSTIACQVLISTLGTLDGKIDEVRTYSKALSETEVGDIYFRNTFPTTNIVSIQKFDEGSGTTATDSSGRGNTGTITGATYSTDIAFTPRSTAGVRQSV